MSEKKKRIQAALLGGATQGLSDAALYAFVIKEVPKASNSKIVRAALMALSDPEIVDKTILDTLYALALKHRMDGAGSNDADDAGPSVAEPEDETVISPAPTKGKRAGKTKGKKSAKR